MYNVKVIEYPKSYQVRLYYNELLENGDDRNVRINRFTGEIVEKKKNGFPVGEWVPVDVEFEEVGRVNEEEYLLHASNRAKNMVYYLARSNVWEYFVTLTLNGEKIDRYNFDEVSKKVRKWFNNIRTCKAKELYYLIVPEMHKDGAWHFHALIGGCAGLSFVDSGKRDKSGKVIYNFEDWKFGFSTATMVEDTERVSSYICKYITKTMLENTKGKNRYWASKNCRRAESSTYLVNGMDFKEFRLELLGKMSWKKKVFTEFNEVEYFEIPKEVEGDE